jgi:hypothetical protein
VAVGGECIVETDCSTPITIGLFGVRCVEAAVVGSKWRVQSVATAITGIREGN